ncbi:unnamed protein product, partial [marine sediment metagenome]
MRLSVVTVCDKRLLGDVAIALSFLRQVRDSLPDNFISCHSFFSSADLEHNKDLFQPYLDMGARVLPSLLVLGTPFGDESMFSWLSKALHHLIGFLRGTFFLTAVAILREAMASGTIVLATPVGLIPDVLKDG